MLKFLNSLKNKKLAALPFEELLKQLAVCQGKEDYTSLSTVYYYLDKAYLARGDRERAMDSFSRSNAIFSALESVQVHENIMDDCSGQIAKLERDPLLANRALEKVQDLGEQLNEWQKCLWGLLSFARLSSLLTRMGGLPGGEFFTHTEDVVVELLEALYNSRTSSQLQLAQDFVDNLYTYGDSCGFLDCRNQLPHPGGEFQPLDLCGQNTLTELYLFLDKFLNLQDEDEEEEGPKAEIDFAPCTLLVGYHLRRQNGPIDHLPQIVRELQRMEEDFHFVQTQPNQEDSTRRIQEYLKIDLLSECTN